jgi:hypothetical protein
MNTESFIHHQRQLRPFDMSLQMNQNKRSSVNTGEDTTTITSTSSSCEQSTLTLLEHINLNVPNHDHILSFYLNILGFGLDPRKASNLISNGRGTIWANCGASQIHLPYGETAQVIPGAIGLRYATLEGLRQRLEAYDHHKKLLQQQDTTKDSIDDSQLSCISDYEWGEEKSGRPYVRIEDQYGNIIFCRSEEHEPTSSSFRRQLSIQSNWKQPLVTTSDTEKFGDIATQYGKAESECLGIDYVEFSCPKGSATKIAQFYDAIFDATTCVLEDKGDVIAMIAFGTIDNVQGRADQYLLFRELPDGCCVLQPYDGHHIALYVGQSSLDFEVAFQNCQLAGVVWVNPRFTDKAIDLPSANKWNQFRFKNILDIATGEVIMELEHEVRSVTHEAFLGSKSSM